MAGELLIFYGLPFTPPLTPSQRFLSFFLLRVRGGRAGLRLGEQLSAKFLRWNGIDVIGNTGDLSSGWSAGNVR